MDAIPIVAVVPALRFPPKIFFVSQCGNIAEHWLGQLDKEDLEPSYRSFRGEGYFVCQTSPKQTRKVTKAFVYGEITGIEDRIAQCIDGAKSLTHTRRVSIKCLSMSTPPADVVFGNNVFTLSEIIDNQSKKGAATAEEWVLNGNPDRPEDGLIFVECGPATELKNGPLNINDCVLFDVSLHRCDSYPEGMAAIEHVFSLVAHSAETVSREFLRGEGWISLELSTQGVEQVVLVVQQQMEKLRVQNPATAEDIEATAAKTEGFEIADESVKEAKTDQSDGKKISVLESRSSKSE
ncbi:hypothetical protein C8R43DRAFT_1126372 [Mycena crocata]|nr:hypothetical protein C8R43DRAFT_1126372 [Mycena crocata]